MHKRAYSESITTNARRNSEDTKEKIQTIKGKDVKETDVKREEENTIQSQKQKEEKLKNVVVRIRKLQKTEKSTLHTDPNDKTVLYFDKNYEIEKYNFDMVFNENDNNHVVFNKIGGPLIVNNVCNGFKETILTYGQTGSGKTYTLFGNKDEYGITYFFLNYLYRMYKNAMKKINIYLSVFEIVGDTLVDLIKNWDDKNTDFYIEEYYLKTIRYTYKVVNIKNFEMAKQIINSACLLRNVDATSQNISSSRSHAIIQLFVNSTEKVLQNEKETVRDSFGVLTLVDLVGCEREDFHLNKQDSKSENKYDSKSDKISSKTLNSSLTSLNKMLRKMQMGMLDESDKRQSVLCKVLFNYIQKTCGVCLIFCFNPKLSQKSLTSSTLIMAYECKKIKSKRKQMIYVKSENKENFFNNITTNDNSENGKMKKGEKNRPIEDHNILNENIQENKTKERNEYDNKKFDQYDNNHNNKTNDKNRENYKCDSITPIFFIFVNENGSVQNVLKKADEDETSNSLRKIVTDILKEQTNEDEKKKNIIKQLENEIVKLKNECKFWKRETQNYHNKLKILNKNYLNINKFLANALNGNNEIKIDASSTIGSSIHTSENVSIFNDPTDNFKSDMSNYQKDNPTLLENGSLKYSTEIETETNKKKSLSEQKYGNKEYAHMACSPKILKNDNLQQKKILQYDKNIPPSDNKFNCKNDKMNRKELIEDPGMLEIPNTLYKENFLDTQSEMDERYASKMEKKIFCNNSHAFQEEMNNPRLKKNLQYVINSKRKDLDLLNVHQKNYDHLSTEKLENTKSFITDGVPFSNDPNFNTTNQRMQSINVVRTNVIAEDHNTRNGNDTNNAIRNNNKGIVGERKEEKDSLENLISNNNYENLKKDVTIDSLANRLKNRMAKTRSLSLAN